MTKRTKPIKLDAAKQREIIAVITVGCSRRTAAKYVGCALSTIQTHANRDPAFAEKLRKAEAQSEITHVKNIHVAAKDQRYWRAAAWILERINREEFGLCPDSPVTPQQMTATVKAFAAIVIEEVSDARKRKRILQRLDQAINALSLEAIAAKRK